MEEQSKRKFKKLANRFFEYKQKMEDSSDLYDPFIHNGSSDYPMKRLGRSEINRIGKWRAFMKGRKFWTDTDEEILRIILDQNDGVT